MDKCASLSATKRSSYHEKRAWQSWSHLAQGERFYETLDLWIKNFSTWRLHCSHWNRARSSWQLQEYLSARYRKPEWAFNLCSAERNHFASLVQTLLHVGDQHRTQPWVCIHHLPIGSSRTARNSQNPVTCSPQGFSDTLPRRALHYIAILMPHFSAREERHMRILARGHLHLHLGHACKLGACTNNKSNLQAMSLTQGRQNHYVLQSQLLFHYS